MMDLARHVSGTRAAEIRASLERAIRDGAAETGARLPTVRELAAHLGVSANTVAAAYRELQLRGLIVSDGRRGTVVRRRPPLSVRPRAAVPDGARNLAGGNPDPALLPDPRPFLARLDLQPPRLYDQRTNDPELLALAAAALRADGLDPAHLAVVGGAMDGLERVLGAHLRPGDRIAVEDPAFPGVIDLLGALGLGLEPVAMDGRGMLPESLERALALGVEACVLTPRAQNPTGAALDRDRAAELVAVLARHPGVLLFEDDHAGAVAGVPLASASAGRERWAVVRSAAKSLGPDLRLAVLAGDAATVARVEGRQHLGTGWVSHVLQKLTVALWRDPQVARLLETATRTYAARREALVEALAGRGLRAHGRSGFNVWVEVPEEAPVLRHLLNHGWGVASGEPFRLRSGPGVRISIGSLQAGEAPLLADLVAASLESAGRTRTA
ncbi:MAG TPA: aminotransferase class I/II-fold pyridoxal phosphate-dependent enzyme [Candidatus Dormibacteraeota bacterium]|jgi:DNA-binding transcriptional MocR family regulator|nr:aminotransferase class I/II-fold pyridoxal phosphate-dependent enzyme [Candidatus Dormibacteraeota bacterium]